MAVFSIGALAIADEHADAVGAVRLSCFPGKLLIELIYVAPFSLGFAPSGVTKERTIWVPYTAIRALVRKGRMLCLALDPSVPTPFHRFALVRFTTDPAELLAGTYRARSVIRGLLYVLPLPLGYGLACLPPREYLVGTLGFAAFALLCAALLFWLLRMLFRFLTWGGPFSDACRDALEAELSKHLGFAGPALAGTGYSPQERAADLALAAEQARSRSWPLHWIIAAAATGALTLLTPAAILFIRQYTAERKSVELPKPIVLKGIASDIHRLSQMDLLPPPLPQRPKRPSCICARPDSPLWKAEIPRLAVFMSSSAEESSGEVKPILEDDEPPYFEFDLAVVNNTEKPMRDVRVVLTFARRNKNNERVGVTDRGFFWGGHLRPGRAVKWHVKAPGTEMRVDISEMGTLSETGEKTAPADSFYELLSARYRIVRLHGAKMLSYLRDPRADEALIRLGPPAPGESELLEALKRANAEIIACDMNVVDGRLSLCVLNASSKRQEHLWAKNIPGPGQALWEAEIADGLGVHEGERVFLPYPEKEPPASVLIESRPPPIPKEPGDDDLKSSD